jgi:UDP-glucose 4-epimerase
MPISLVTGAAGFMGSHVAAELLKTGHRVVALDDLSGGFVEHLPPGTDFVEGSILDRTLIDNVFQQRRFDYVFHLAAYAAEGLSHFIKHFNYQNNLIGSVNLINASVNHNVKCFVFTSSIAVYGNAPLPMTEETTPQPEDSYGIAKFAVERELHVTHEMFGLDFVIFRPHNVYGEHQNIGDRYRNVIGIFMNQILQALPLSVFGDGSQTRAFSYISDVAPIIARSIAVSAARNQIFNVGADTPYSVNHLAEVVMQAMGNRVEVKHLPARNEVVHAYSDHSKVQRVFRLRKSIELAEGIARMAEWTKAAGPRQSKVFDAIEISRNLPSSWLQG